MLIVDWLIWQLSLKRKFLGYGKKSTLRDKLTTLPVVCTFLYIFNFYCFSTAGVTFIQDKTYSVPTFDHNRSLLPAKQITQTCDYYLKQGTLLLN